MSDQTQTEFDPAKKVSALASKFWWLRGAAAAVTLAALVPTFVKIERYEYLLALHLLVVAWTAVAAQIGALIGKLPFLPPLTHESVSTLVFASSVALPACFALAKNLLNANAGVRQHQKNLRSLDKVLFALVASRVSSLVLVAFFFSVTVWGYHSLITFDFTEKVEITHVEEKFKVPGIVDEKGNPAELTIRRQVKITTSKFPVGHVVSTAATVALFVYSLYLFRGVRRGFVFVVTFLLASQLLYFASIPGFSDAICEIAKAELPETSKHCRAQSTGTP